MQPGLTSADSDPWTKTRAWDQKRASDSGYLTSFSGNSYIETAVL